MKIFVAMHKYVNIDINNILYVPILVGNNKKEKKIDILSDDTGDNISKKNTNYCELTAVYWIWKNSKEDIVGLCHYRRFLSKKFFSSNSKYYINEDDLREDFNNGYNVILPKKFFYYKKIKDSFNIAPNKNDMKIVKESIERLYPDYLKDLDKYFNSNSSYLCNVIVTKKEIFDEYCEWLFDVLADVEKNMDKETYINDSYRKRMFGFLSERLLNIWLYHNQESLKIKEYYLINTEEKFNKKLSYLIKQTILKIINK